MTLRKRIKELLEHNNMPELITLSEQAQGVFRVLISLAYDKNQLLCWRAIEALGIISGEIARKEPERIRNLIGRLLWTIREESGGIGWSAPEMLGEIVRNAPDIFSDIAPIISSFYEEDMLKRGVIRALVRIGEIRPDLVQNAASLVRPALEDEDAHVRAYAILLAGCLRLTACIKDIEHLREDKNEIVVYEYGDLQTMNVSSIAKETVILLHSSE
jgi:HEAT repeat protein